MSTIGRIAVWLTALVALFVILRSCRPISKWVVSKLPEPVVEFFSDQQPSRHETGAPDTSRSLFDELNKKLEPSKKPSEPAPAPRRFIKPGMSKAEVIAIQGTPSRVAGDTWYYGESEIYFTGDVVAGWRASSRSPLRVE